MTQPPSSSGHQPTRQTRGSWLLPGGVAVVAIVAAMILIPRLNAPRPSAPAPKLISPSETYPVVIGWSGGGNDHTELFVQVKNTTGQDVYVKSLELRGAQSEPCGRVPRFAELVSPHPFVRANETRSVVPNLRVEGATQRELAMCEIKAYAVIVRSATYPGVEAPESLLVSESRALGN